ncbi:tetratricopeptide repeat protein, partial [Streptomyces sp. NPDC102365]|uniref:tetratricopeptide repeat protein n=1 Tax=Streptomyces sp. NPDC102365 TaxID=3366162 RepID=UPI00382B7E62
MLAKLPHQVGVFPPRARSFQERAEADRLRTAVDGGGTAVLGQVLTGLGGVGKTQLAADHARHAWDAGEIDVLVWVTASSRTAIVTAYAQAGAELLGTDPGDPDQASSMFLAWLGSKPYRWLIVLDDLADPADIRGLWPPDVPHGRTLVTTRRRDAALTGAGRHLVQIGVFTPDQAASYLGAALPPRHGTEDADELALLAAELAYLPLALSQAAAYLADQGMSVAAYRRVLADRTHTLAEAVPEPDVLPDDQTLTLAAVWSLSVEHADKLRPEGLARLMLHLTSVLDPNGIPESALTSPSALAYLDEQRTNTGTPSTSEQAFGALRALHRMNLIDHTPDGILPSVRVHQLVQRVSRESLGPGDRERSVAAAADALAAIWPDIERDPDLTQILRSNAQIVASVEGLTLVARGIHQVLFTLGASLGNGGQVQAATDHFRDLAEAANGHLGPDHPDTLTARYGLAHWRGEAGDLAGAALATAELLTDQMRVLGPDHPDTFTTRYDLARWHGYAGNPAGAAQAAAELLTDRTRVLGPDHPDTFTTRYDLARWHGYAGNPAGAA